MRTDFICPKCRGHLSVDGNVIFAIKDKNHVGGLLLLSPLLGEYTYKVHPSYPMQPGEKFDFFCPICHASLNMKDSDNLAKVILLEDDAHEHYVVFSRKEGEQCTYKVSNERLQKYGPDSQKYLDFLSACMLK
jgi:hypothetical protein